MPRLRMLVLALPLVAGCARSSPEATVRALATAARDGDGAEALKLLGPRTRARLAQDARLASEQAGRRHFAPGDLLAVGWAAPSDEIAGIQVVERTADRAVVEVTGRRGTRQRLALVSSGGRWKLELP